MNSPTSQERLFSIAAVARDTGLSMDTLRVWERRYGFPAPERDVHGERVYPAGQVDRLRLIRRLLDSGRRPSQVVGLGPDALAALLEPEAPRSQGPSPAGRATEELVALLRLHRSAELATALNQALLKQGLQRFVVDAVAPLNQEVGEAWLRGDIQVTEEHLYTEQVQNVLRRAIGMQAASGSRPHILLTTLPEEQHGLGLLMVEATLVPEGASCLSLGPRMPLADIARAVEGGDFDVVGLSFSLAYPARQAMEHLAELRALLPPTVEIWAGGGGLRARSRAIPGVRIITELGGALEALREWRQARPDSGPRTAHLPGA